MGNKVEWEDILNEKQLTDISNMRWRTKEDIINIKIGLCFAALRQAEKEGKVAINPPIQELENIYQGLKENSLEPDKIICIAGHLKKVIQVMEGKI